MGDWQHEAGMVETTAWTYEGKSLTGRNTRSQRGVHGIAEREATRETGLYP
jgi:hypothetical protein